MRINKTIAQIRAKAIKNQTTDLDNVKSFSAEGKDFLGLNKTVRVPFPKPKIRPMDATTFPGSKPDNGKIREETQPKKEPKQEEKPKLDNTIKGLKRRMKNSEGHMFLKPQAEAYVAPNTGNNNYAQNLPAPSGAGAKRTNMNKKLSKSTLAPSAQYEDGVIMSLSDLESIFEIFINGQLGEQIDGYVYEELKVGDKDEDNNEAKKFRGTNAKGPGTGKVARRYLGKQRGTTATGKQAHVIITNPVMGEKDKNWNKTTPSGSRKSVKEAYEKLGVGKNINYNTSPLTSKKPDVSLEDIGSKGGPIFRFNPLGPMLYTPGLSIYMGIAFGELKETEFKQSPPKMIYNEPMIDPRVYSYPIRKRRE